jgi:hypothetical protein
MALLAVMNSGFKIGDRVERVGALVPTWMRVGIVIRIIPNKQGIDWATEYEVDFGTLRAHFYQTQLRLIDAAQHD